MKKIAQLPATTLLLGFLWPVALSSQAILPSSLTNGFTPPGLEPGTPEHSYALSGFDNISYFNGKLNFRLPLLKIGGRGEAGYTMMLPIEREWSANAIAYYPSGGNGSSNPTGYTLSPTSDFGFNIAVLNAFIPGSVYGRVATTHTTTTCPLSGLATQNVTVVTSALTRFTFYEPDGTGHELRDAATGGVAQPNPNECFPPNPGYDRGRVFLSYDETALMFVADQDVYDSYGDGSPNSSPFGISFPITVYASGTLYFPDGRSYTIDSQGRVTKIRDRNGNLVNLVYQTDSSGSPTGIQITDPVGRVIQVTYGSFTASTAQTTISYPAYKSSVQHKIVVNSATLGTSLRSDYTNQPAVTCADGSTSPKGIQTLSGLFPETALDLTQCYNPMVVTSVVLPNNQSYQMHYNPYGELARVDLPTGGAFEYDFGSAVSGSTSGVMQFNGSPPSGVETQASP